MINDLKATANVAAGDPRSSREDYPTKVVHLLLFFIADLSKNEFLAGNGRDMLEKNALIFFASLETNCLNQFLLFYKVGNKQKYFQIRD